MITPVGNNNYTNAYTNAGKRNMPDEDVPKFLIGDEDGVVYEPAEKTSKAKEGIKENSKPAKSDTRAAYMTLSIEQEASKSQEDKKTFLGSFLEGVRSFFSKIAHFIWYGDEKKDAKADAETSEEKASENIHLEIRESGATGQDVKADAGEDDTLQRPTRRTEVKADMSPQAQYEQYVAGKRLAHNSTLLTQYDRHGNLVKVNGSDSARLLQKDNTYTV